MNESRKLSVLPVGNLIAFFVTIVVNALSVILPLNGRTPSEISDSYPNLFTPAGYVFSIWSVIYILLFIFSVYQALPNQRDNPILKEIGVYFILSCGANITWIFLWHYEYIVLSVVPMFILLGSLIMIYLRLDIGRAQKVSRAEKLCVHLPFSVYLGWITVAPIANVAAALVSIGWNGFGISDIAWTMVMISTATLLTAIVTLTRRDIGYGLVIIWALGGIIFKQIHVLEIVSTAVIGLMIIIITFTYSSLRSRI